MNNKKIFFLIILIFVLVNTFVVLKSFVNQPVSIEIGSQTKMTIFKSPDMRRTEIDINVFNLTGVSSVCYFDVDYTSATPLHIGMNSFIMNANNIWINTASNGFLKGSLYIIDRGPDFGETGLFLSPVLVLIYLGGIYVIYKKFHSKHKNYICSAYLISFIPVILTFSTNLPSISSLLYNPSTFYLFEIFYIIFLILATILLFLEINDDISLKNNEKLHRYFSKLYIILGLGSIALSAIALTISNVHFPNYIQSFYEGGVSSILISIFFQGNVLSILVFIVMLSYGVILSFELPSLYFLYLGIVILKSSDKITLKQVNDKLKDHNSV